MRYFEILGIHPPQLGVSLSDLEARYYRAALASHPDKNAGSVESETTTAEINKAYRVLRDPWSRAEYVIEALGRSLGSALPTSLAEVYFETQEAEDQSKMRALGERLEADEVIRLQKLERIFGSLDLGGTSVPDLQSLIELVTEHKYASSMFRDLQSKLQGNADYG